MQRLVRYHKGIEKGLIKVDAKPEIVFETPVSAVIDGHDGMGQLIAHFAMKQAIERQSNRVCPLLLCAIPTISALRAIALKWPVTRG